MTGSVAVQAGARHRLSTARQELVTGGTSCEGAKHSARPVAGRMKAFNRTMTPWQSACQASGNSKAFATTAGIVFGLDGSRRLESSSKSQECTPVKYKAETIARTIFDKVGMLGTSCGRCLRGSQLRHSTHSVGHRWRSRRKAAHAVGR
jgi:hypothetical protein